MEHLTTSAPADAKHMETLIPGSAQEAKRVDGTASKGGLWGGDHLPRKRHPQRAGCGLTTFNWGGIVNFQKREEKERRRDKRDGEETGTERERWRKTEEKEGDVTMSAAATPAEEAVTCPSRGERRKEPRDRRVTSCWGGKLGCPNRKQPHSSVCLAAGLTRWRKWSDTSWIFYNQVKPPPLSAHRPESPRDTQEGQASRGASCVLLSAWGAGGESPAPCSWTARPISQGGSI